jgi:hypothetical protein
VIAENNTSTRNLCWNALLCWNGRTKLQNLQHYLVDEALAHFVEYKTAAAGAAANDVVEYFALMSEKFKISAQSLLTQYSKRKLQPG